MSRLILLQLSDISPNICKEPKVVFSLHKHPSCKTILKLLKGLSIRKKCITKT